MENNSSLRVASFLTWIAGFVDAVGFICLGHIYTANMSGNSVAVGIQAAARDWPETLKRLCPVVAYFVGLIFCRVLIEIGARERIRRIASAAFLCEIAVIAPLCAAQALPKEFSAAAFLYIALLAIGMGIQNAALTRFSSLTVHTGFVTGTLVKAAEELTKYLTCLYDHARAPNVTLTHLLAHPFREKPFHVAAWLLGIWTSYVVGAVCGALSQHQFTTRALIVPMAGLVFLIALDLREPLATGEEKQQQKVES